MSLTKTISIFYLIFLYFIEQIRDHIGKQRRKLIKYGNLNHPYVKWYKKSMQVRIKKKRNQQKKLESKTQQNLIQQSAHNKLLPTTLATNLKTQNLETKTYQNLN